MAGPNRVDDAVAIVRDAGCGMADAKAIKRARQVAAGTPAVVSVLASFDDGSPDAQSMLAALRELGCTAGALNTSVRWWRAQERKRAREAEASDDDRPLIQAGPELNRDIAAAIDALSRDPDIYQRQEQLVRVVMTDDGEPVIRPHTAATLRARLAFVARFEYMHPRSDEWVPCLPPESICQGVLEAREYPGIRSLSAVTESPSMRPDMTIFAEPGHDPVTGLLYIPNAEYPPIPEAPTLEQAQESLRYLWVELCHGAPTKGMGYAPDDWRESDPDGVLRFVKSKSCPDAWGLIGMIFSQLTRPVYVDSNIPAHIVSAPTPGSGKGLMVDVACIVGRGQIPEKPTWPEADSADARKSEVDKMLLGEARKGATVTVFDEIQTQFGSGGLQNALTGSGKFTARILGQSENPTYRWRPVILGCGPNVSFADNMLRRVLRINLDPVNEEHPDRRGNWRHPDLKGWAKTNRARLVVEALTALRAYVVAGMPDMGLPVWGGGFESWSKLVPRAIVWAGGANILACRPDSNPEERNEEKDRVAAVLAAVEKLEPKDAAGNPTRAGITIASMLSLLYTRERLKGEPVPDDGFDATRDAIEAITGVSPGRKPKAHPLSEALKHWKERPIGGKQLEHAGKKDNAVRWTVRDFARATVAITPPAAQPTPEPAPRVETNKEHLAREAEDERLNCG